MLLDFLIDSVPPASPSALSNTERWPIFTDDIRGLAHCAIASFVLIN